MFHWSIYFDRTEINIDSVSMLTEIEIACEFVLSIPLIRLLFISICSQYEQFGDEQDNASAFAIEKALDMLGDAFELNILEHPFVPGMNVLSDRLLTYEPSIRIGVRRIIHEMQQDWKRSIRR
jgi:hypothetical protein